MTSSISTNSVTYLQQLEAARAQQPQTTSKPAQQQPDSVQLSAQAKAAVAGSKDVDHDGDSH